MNRAQAHPRTWLLATGLLGLVIAAVACCSHDARSPDAPACPHCPDCHDGHCPACPHCPHETDWTSAPAGAVWANAGLAGADNPYGLPPMQLPPSMRERNYSGGSCVHASMEMCLRWQGFEELADWWRQKYHGGEHASGLISKAEAAGLRFAATTNGDANFLEWASRTRRGAVIFYKPSHSIVFCGYDGETAVLLDNNAIGDFERVPKATFVQRWKGFGGFALSPVATPRPPKMWALSRDGRHATPPGATGGRFGPPVPGLIALAVSPPVAPRRLAASDLRGGKLPCADSRCAKAKTPRASQEKRAHSKTNPKKRTIASAPASCCGGHCGQRRCARPCRRLFRGRCN